MSDVKSIDLDLYEHFDTKAWLILIADDNQLYEMPHVYLNEEIVGQDIENFRKKHPKIEPQLFCDTMGAMMNLAIHNNLEYIILRSFMDISVKISLETILPMKDALDIFTQIVDFLINKQSREQLLLNIANENVYFVSADGSIANFIDNRDKIIFGQSIIKRPTAEGNSHEVVPVFLTAESAKKFAEQNAPIVCAKFLELTKLWNYTKPIIIEPMRRFTVEFSAEELAQTLQKIE